MLVLLFVVCGALGFGIGRLWRRRRVAQLVGRGEKIDLLLLLSAPRILPEEHLRASAREAFGREADRVVTRGTGGTIRIDGYALIALPAPEPMVSDLEDAAEGIPELRMRIAFLEHKAFIIVTCVERPKQASRDDAYAYVGRLTAALADDTARLVYSPETRRGNLVNDETLAGLRSGDPLATMRSVTFDAIGLVSGEDPQMVAATAEARRRLPEFVAAVRSGRRLEMCLVKGPFTDGTHTEFMWVAPTEVVGEAIRGTLTNAPFQVRGLCKGSTVEVAFAEVSDWCYPGETGMVGMFTEKIVRSAL